MRNELEQLHKILGQICGEICISLTIYRVSGGKATIRKWLELTRQAEAVLEKLAA